MTENSERHKWLKRIREMQFQRWGCPTLSDWLKGFSIETWMRIRFSINNWTPKTLETTITQNLLFDFYNYAEQRTLPIKIFESRDEHSNGNDLEIVVETSMGYLILPTQAKIINKNFRYPGVKYKNAKGYQLDLLLDYARKKRGIPLYLFYNSCNDARIAARITKLVDSSVVFFGCSIANAHQLKAKYYHAPKNRINGRWTIPDFEGIHSSIGLPFHHLADSDLSGWAAGHQSGSGDTVEFYTGRQIMADPAWRNLLPEGIGFISGARVSRPDAISIPDRAEPVFNPRFRLVIANTKIHRNHVES
jgi:hypothetical protein